MEAEVVAGGDAPAEVSRALPAGVVAAILVHQVGAAIRVRQEAAVTRGLRAALAIPNLPVVAVIRSRRAEAVIQNPLVVAGHDPREGMWLPVLRPLREASLPQEEGVCRRSLQPNHRPLPNRRVALARLPVEVHRNSLLHRDPVAAAALARRSSHRSQVQALVRESPLEASLHSCPRNRVVARHVQVEGPARRRFPPSPEQGRALLMDRGHPNCLQAERVLDSPGVWIVPLIYLREEHGPDNQEAWIGRRNCHRSPALVPALPRVAQSPLSGRARMTWASSSAWREPVHSVGP